MYQSNIEKLQIELEEKQNVKIKFFKFNILIFI